MAGRVKERDDMPETSEILKQAFSALSARNFAEAETHSRRLLREQPTNAGALYVLAHVSSDIGDDMESVRLLREAIVSDPRYGAAYWSLARAHYISDRFSDAADVYRQWAIAEPHNPHVQHMVAALTGQSTPSRCSTEYVKSEFDSFAFSFDDVLVDRLDYRGPEIIVPALQTHIQTGSRLLNVLDAGCGTGLCGPGLRKISETLTGVDLSENMIRRARARECYDELVVSDLCQFMDSSPTGFDAIVSSDVLIYFGALEEVIQAAHRALKPNGLLAVTLEALLDLRSEPYVLQVNGRYSHTESYVRSVLAQSRFDVLTIEQQWLRREKGKEVTFHVVVARRL
jgi:predicted TPR repeat methyltransferase